MPMTPYNHLQPFCQNSQSVLKTRGQIVSQIHVYQVSRIPCFESLGQPNLACKSGAYFQRQRQTTTDSRITLHADMLNVFFYLYKDANGETYK